MISRLAVSRHTGSFVVPWRRGVAPILVGLAVLSVSLIMLGVVDGVVRLWAMIGLVAVVIVVSTTIARRRTS